MPGPLDLPNEVLQNIPLPTADLKNVILTCRTFQLCFEPLLYKRIVRSWPYKLSEVGQTEYGSYRSLLHALNKRPHLLNYIQHLNMSPNGCYHNKFGIRLLTDSIFRMDNLRSLELETFWCCLLKSPMPLPKLETLHILSDRGYTVSTKDIDIIVSLQPCVKRLVISMMCISSTEETSDIFNSSLADIDRVTGNKVVPSNLVELQLLDSDISPAFLKEIILRHHNLHSYVNTRWIDDHYTYPIEDWTLYDMSNALYLMKNRLRNLGLFHDNCYRFEDEKGLLSSLTQFTNLEHVKIDPAILLGRHGLEDDGEPSVRQLRPISEFASLLPSTLRMLTLCIDQDQCALVKNYRNKLLQPLLEDQLRFVQLEKIVMLELKYMSTQYEVEDKPLRAEETRGLSMTAQEMYAFWHLKARFQALGVTLDLRDFETEDLNQYSWQRVQERRHVS